MPIIKIIGLVLLGLLALALLLVLMVLFIPLRYVGDFKKNEKEMTGKGRLTWLFGLVSIKIKYENEKVEKQGRIAFVKLWKDEEAKEPEKHAPRQESPKKEAQKQAPTKRKAPKEKAKKKKRKASGKPTPVDRLKNLFKNRDILIDLTEDNMPIIAKAFARAKKLILHVIPKKIDGYVHFGFEDPSATGKVLGLASALYGRTGVLVRLIPDFENAVFDCDIRVKGRIRIFTVALIFILLYFNKELNDLKEKLITLSVRPKEGN